MKVLMTTALVASLAAGAALAAGHLPLKELPDIAERDYWVPDEVSAERLRDADAAVAHTRAQDPGVGPVIVDLRFADQIVVRRIP